MFGFEPMNLIIRLNVHHPRILEFIPTQANVVRNTTYIRIKSESNRKKPIITALIIHKNFNWSKNITHFLHPYETPAERIFISHRTHRRLVEDCKYDRRKQIAEISIQALYSD